MKLVDRLSKDMAQGVSRRKALWMFLAGSAAFSVAGTKKASAGTLNPQLRCLASCAAQAEAFLALCVASAAQCPSGRCAEFTLIPLNVNSTTIQVNGRCIQVNGNKIYALEENCTTVPNPHCLSVN